MRHTLRVRRRGLLAVMITAVLGVLMLSGCGAPTSASAPATSGELRTIDVDGVPFAYCASRGVESLDETITRVIVAVHGLDRNACGMRRSVLAAIGGEPAGTVVIAPWFAGPDDRATGHTWALNSWPAGDASSSGVSSFAALDELISRVASRVDDPRPPDGEREVVVVGFSGGGQFVNRYAATSPVTASRYIVMSPSTYVWFTPRRPGPTASCTGVNAWRYGLADRPGHPYVGGMSGEEIRRRYASRTVVHLVGATDNDPDDGSLDRSCAAMAQGHTRVDRARNYAAHLSTVFGPRIATTHPLIVVPDAPHDPVAVLAGDEGRRALGLPG